MRVLDLFSGIGGFSLGLEACGMTTTAFCERDPYCQSILKKHWPKTPVHTDVRNLDGKQYQGSIDVVAGGFPCQPFSVAGKRLGSEDDRHLWPEMLRIIRECRPRWVIGENVSGFVKMALDDVSSDLEGEGYAVRAFVLPAVAVEARHRRDRCFIIAHRQDVAYACGKGLQRHGQEHQLRGFGEEEQVIGRGDVAHTIGSRSEAWLSGQEQGQEGHSGEFNHEGYQRSWWETGGEWATEPSVGRVANGVPNRVDRIKSLGNAVVPQLIQAIGELVIAADKEIYAHE
tara:strand:- start:1457 stop:2314 length:858 start_codon:yes stop_codon:yes gene_type:complete